MAHVHGVHYPEGQDIYALPADFKEHAETDAQQAIDAAATAAAAVFYDILTSALLPRADGEITNVYTWADRDGNVGMSLNSRAELTVYGGIVLPDESLDLTAINSPVKLVATTHTDTAWVHGIADNAGHLAMAVDSAGRFRPFRGAGAPTAMRTQVACIGDSLTLGASDGGAWPVEQTWPYLMEQAHPGVTVTNLGLSGWACDEIRIRWGIQPLYLTPAGGTIPTTGAVSVTTGAALGMRPVTVNFPGTLAGVPGTLTWDGTAWTFTRRSAGEAVTVGGKARFVPDTPDDYSSHTVVLWLGRNDLNNNLTGRWDTVTDHVVAGVLDTVEWLAPRSKAVVVVGTTQTVNEDNTHPRYQSVIDINNRLAQLLPTKYLDMRSYLVHQAIYDAGLTPTQADLDAMAADGPPPQIWDGGSHFLPVVAPYVAEQIGTALEQRGLI